MNESDQRFFFVHVMKTGGSTFRQHIKHNFPALGAMYPDVELDGNVREANFIIEPLLQISPERKAQVRAYTGHFPFVVARLLDPRLITLTVLRDPVERTVSYLKQCKRLHVQHRDLALEEIYEDPFFNPTMIWNHQVKIFAMTSEDRLESHLDVIEIDDERRRVAEANLESVDLLGLHSSYDEFLSDVQRRLGWEILERPSWRVSTEDWEVSDAFRRRVAEDNAADVAFYEFACQLAERRARSRI